MKNSITPRPVRRAALGVLAALTLLSVSILLLPAAEKPATAAPSTASLAHDLQGTWVHVGEPGKIGETPAKGGFIKLRTAHHWAAISVDPRSGLVASTHGGTWKVTGNVYQETVDYGNDFHAQWMGKTYTWDVTLVGDTMTKQGTNNPWHEVWKRVK